MNDILMIETFFTPINNIKIAQSLSLSSLWQKAQEYFNAKIDPANPKKSLIDVLAPGAIFLLFKSFNMSFVGALIALATNYFDVSIYDILVSICDKTKSLISSSDEISEQDMQQIAQSTTQEFYSPGSEEQVEKFYTKQSSVQINKLKRAVLLYDLPIIKVADLFGKGSQAFNKTKFSLIQFVSRTFSTLLSVGLIAAGFMVAGDLLRKLTGKPIKSYKSQEQSTIDQPDTEQSIKQVKSKSWYENIIPTKENIEKLLLTFVKDTIHKDDPTIKSSISFQKVVDEILYYNRGSLGNVTFIPPMFKSKQDIVNIINE